MDIDRYQVETDKTARYPGAFTDQGVLYATLGAIGELGEALDVLEPCMFETVPEDEGPNGVVALLHCAIDLAVIAECYKKALRDDAGVMTDERLKRARSALLGLRMSVDYLAADLEGEAAWIDPPLVNLDGLDRDRYIKELGDVYWYLARMATEAMVDTSDVLEMNVAKLRDRKRRGVIKGDGDKR